MSNCKTCKWWYQYTNDRIIGQGTCDYEEREGEGEFYISSGGEKSNDFWVELRTGPEFGCVHHEEKAK